MGERLTGNQYKKLIAAYMVAAYGDRGIQIYEEVHLGTSMIGKQRRIDLFVLHPASGVALAVECKFQDSPGTVDEKIPYALQDLRAMRMPGVIVYAGAGFSEGVLHLLQSAEDAAYCFPEAPLQPIGRKQGDRIDCGTWQLDHILAQTFRWWDIVLSERRLFVE
jgi:hypothetical protein